MTYARKLRLRQLEIRNVRRSAAQAHREAEVRRMKDLAGEVYMGQGFD